MQLRSMITIKCNSAVDGWTICFLSCMQGSHAKREVLSDQAKLLRLGRQTAPPASSISFGQVTTSRRKDSEHAAQRSPGRGPRSLPPDEKEPAARQRQNDDLLNQLRRLQLLQQEAQELLL